MSIIDGLLRSKEKRRIEAQKHIRKMAEAEALGKAAERGIVELEKALADAGLDHEGFSDLVQHYKGLAKLKTEAGKCDELGAELSAGRATERKLKEDLERFNRETAEKLRATRCQIIETARKLDIAQQAACQIEAAEYSAAVELNMDTPNLDAHTLKTASGAATIAIHDSGAPSLCVPDDVYERESARRRELLEAAYVKAREAHRVAVNQWKATAPRGMDDFIKTPPPELVLPTWPDLAKELEGKQ